MKKNVIAFVKIAYAKALMHKYISIAVIIALLLGLYYFFSQQKTVPVTYQYTRVMRGTLSSSVSATGQVAATSQVDLKPKVNANITGVYVKAGDKVKTGQVLFRLDATDAYKQVRDAKTALASANIALEKLRNPKSIDVMSVNDSIKQEEDSKKDQDTKVATAYNNLLNAGLQAIPEVAYTPETAPTITGNYLKGIEGQIKITVYQGGTSGYSFSAEGPFINTTGQVNTSVAQPLGDTGLFIKWNNANPQTNWIISIPNKQASSYLTNYNSWQTAVNNRDIANRASDRNILSLRQKLADLSPSDDDLDVQSAKIQVEQKQNALLDAQQNLSNYVIVAPFDGTMASVTGDIGVSAVVASSNSSTALGTIVTDKKIAQVTLNESDIVKVRLGQKANITFDAINGLTIEGTVVEINTLGTVTSGVVTYKVKVAFNTDDVRVLPNMSVSVDILTDSKDDTLYLPNQAVKHDANGYYVEKDSADTSLQNGSSTRAFDTSSTSRRYLFASSTGASSSRPLGYASSTRRRAASSTGASQTGTAVTSLIRVPVQIGIQSTTQTEILGGLHEGEKVILKKVTTTVSSATASAPSITSLFRPTQARPSGATPRAQ